MWDYLAILRRRWPLVVSGLLAGVLVGWVSTLGDEEGLVESSAAVLVQTPEPGMNVDPPAGERLVATVAELAESGVVTEAVEERIGGQPQQPVVAAVVDGTDVIELTVRSADSQRASELVNAYAQSLADTSAELIVPAVVISEASSATTVEGASTPRQVVLLAFVGAVIGCTVALGVELYARRPPPSVENSGT
jgi:capsular polysaccharide biosynthesis protein